MNELRNRFLMDRILMRGLLIITVFAISLWGQLPVMAQPYKVLVVESYEPDFTWVEEVREGIESVLAGKAEITHIYLRTKENLDAGPARAREAYQYYLKNRPDGVIAVDDNAQSMFVVPYLRNKVDTPVIFCGVNAPPEKYGYPASNVSGVLERQHFGEAVAMMKQLMPSLSRVGFMMKAGPTADLIIAEIRQERYLADVVAYNTPSTVAEARNMAEEMKQSCDAVYITNLTGLVDDNGASLTDDVLIPMVANWYGKPLFSGSTYNIRFKGVLVAVAKTGQEQGSTAAKMLMKAMSGTPIPELSITRNRFGKRMINISTLKHFKLPANPDFLRSAEIVKGEE